ncbi:MAG: hypothetical protein KF799_03430 [Bdellovibrionales bacterium]|nr:hypothetical protein [Bdellovibrionales bacterium]
MTKKSSNLATNGRVSPTYQGPAEAAFCSTTYSYGDPVTITGSARYIRRNVWGNASVGGLGTASLSGLHPATAHPIRGAEIRVTDSSGNVVQCADSGTGSFSLQLPRGNTTYTVSVNSRANNTLLYASVLNQPEKNQFYSLTANVTTNGSVNIGMLTAAADGDALGAAFNILDQLYNANAYLRSQVSNCSSFTGCKSVTASMTTLNKTSSPTSGRIPKVTAYWTNGYNPNNYFGGTGGLSFYLPDYSRLFILGGQNGDLNSSDTDHFDDSVIIHEYGHFLEDIIGISDSPGGQHTGTKPIDPRLAWSEGWGNFFQAAVRGDNHYIDTIGNDDGETDMAFYVDLETVLSAAGYDYPTQTGEGNFREFSVSRMLWDVIDTNPDNGGFGGANETISNAFNEIWAAFSSTTQGFPYSLYAFRNIGLLHLIQRDYNATDWSDARAANRHDGDTSEYGQYLTTTSCGAAPYPGGYYFSISPASYSGDDGSFAKSDLLNNNDFFHFKAPVSGSKTITLEYKDVDGNAQEADLDLYIYKEDYTYGASASWAGVSRKNPVSPLVVESEPVTFNMTAGANYLLNVFVYTGSGIGTPAYYNLKYEGQTLCRATIVP